jgi:hypothetical protein
MIEAQLHSGQIVTFDGRVLEIFEAARSSRRHHLAQLAAPRFDGDPEAGYTLTLDGASEELRFAGHELPIAKRLLAAIGRSQA